MKAFVTGGAGFIGSHIVDRLIHDGAQVIVYDNFSTGQKSFLKPHERLNIIEGDILDQENLVASMKGCDFVFHLAANADVRGGIQNTTVDLEQNTVGTHRVLEATRINKIRKVAFSSSGTVYGEPTIFPTPENCELIQTSLYGASKLANEAMIQAYCEYFDMQSWVFRFVSWIGERYTHGVVFDFIKKLKDNESELEILGDGEQKKSYLYVKDGVEGIFHAIKHLNDKSNVVNLGHTDFMNVKDLANIVCRELNLTQVKYHFTGGTRGWKGDSPFVHLDISKLSKTGWEPKVSIEEGIRKTARYLLENFNLLERA